MRHVLTHELFACKDFLIIYIILSSSIQRILSEFWNLWLVRGALWTPLSDSAITTSRKEHNLWCGILKLYEIHIHWSMFWCYCWCYDGLVFCSWVLISNLKKHITPPPPFAFNRGCACGHHHLSHRSGHQSVPPAYNRYINVWIYDKYIFMYVPVFTVPCALYVICCIKIISLDFCVYLMIFSFLHGSLRLE